MAQIERTVKVVLVSVSSVKTYSRWEWRAVECNPDQRGHLSERGVKVLYNSGPLYRPNTCRGKGPEAKRHAIQTAQAHAAAQTGCPQYQAVVN